LIRFRHVHRTEHWIACGYWLLVTGYWCLTSLNIAQMISDNQEKLY